MYKSVVIEHFGSRAAVAETLGISAQAVSLWKEVIPEVSARRLADATAGALKFDESLYRSVA